MFEKYHKTIFIFIGLQASGKSTFYKRFLSAFSHISLDILKTRHREAAALQKAVSRAETCVIDNTNPTCDTRKKYIETARFYGYKIVGIYFRSSLKECLARNRQREGKAFIPPKALFATAKKLQLPSYQEGFDELYYVKTDGANFNISPWENINEI